MKTLRPLAAFGFTLFVAAFASFGRFEAEPRLADPTPEQIDAAVSHSYAAAGLEEERSKASR